MKWRSPTIIVVIHLVFISCFNVAMAKAIMLKEKIGQMLIIGFKGMELKPDDAIVKAILAQQIGGVVLFDYDFKTKSYHHNIKSPEQLKQLTQQLQGYAREAALEHGNRLTPLLISIDNEGGKVNRLKENYGFTKTLSAADIGHASFEQAKRYAQQMAQTLKAEGINLNFAPVIDVNVNPDNPVIGKLGRSFSDDPQKVADYAAVFAKAFHDHGILCAFKHFPGHGSSGADTHAGLVDVTQTWKEYELTPYKQLLRQSNGCAMVMTGHVIHYGLDEKGYPASLSAAMTTKLLREQFHFNGVVITDDLQMKAIADHYSLGDTVLHAVNAGADILVFGNQLVSKPQDPSQIVEMIYQDVVAGKISENRINEAFNRIMKLKEHL